MILSRRAFLAAASSAMALAAVDPRYKLIAHRGGIVDDQHPENSPGSLEAAISRGYWMVEVDIRRTKDGEPILQHDADFRRFYGNPGKVEEMTWAEVSALRGTPGNSKPIHFRDACAMCEGRIRMMLDIKGTEWPDSFYNGLADSLRKHQLLATAFLLGGGSRPARIFGHECFQSSNRKSLAEAVARGEDVANRRFLFELASELDEEALALCRKHGVTPVAAINTFRYTMAKRDEWKGPEEDAARLKKLGVLHYQIDSRYDPLFAGSIE
ncbi:hypothetical protein F183_A45480 [Bryobacterales bacterium F-183]|nr:hypothetical protein F183_A45480 [Bryobacterales bacterium F-183]